MAEFFGPVTSGCGRPSTGARGWGVVERLPGGSQIDVPAGQKHGRRRQPTPC